MAHHVDKVTMCQHSTESLHLTNNAFQYTSTIFILCSGNDIRWLWWSFESPLGSHVLVVISPLSDLFFTGLISCLRVLFLVILPVDCLCYSCGPEEGLGPLLTGLVVGANIMAAGAFWCFHVPNPARFFEPGLVSGVWTNHWVY